MCHCVLVLHLIGLTYDVADNIKNPDVLGITDDRPLKIPSLLEIFAFSYFPATVLIGPQFSFKRFNDFIDFKYEDGVSFFY
jgi:lysophospholipid acyltransferase 5